MELRKLSALRILQVTNIVSPHQLPLAHCLVCRLGGNNFRFVATDPPLLERAKLGWNTQAAEPWILRAGEKESDRAAYEKWWDEADVVIAGNRDVPKIADRVRQGKLTFYMSERWWKPPLGIARLLHPRFAWMAYRFARLTRMPNFHYLPMGGYAAGDMRRIASFQERIWDWGYFTAMPDPLPPCLKREGAFRVLWAGRMLAWKRVDTLIRAFGKLLSKAPDCRLTLIGQGPCRSALEALVQKLGISGSVDFRDSVPASEVRLWMRKAHVYVLPSNGYEGWGAVVNEAMSEGCPVVASEAVGAAKSMIRHGENGLLFKPGDHVRLSDLLLQLNTDESLRFRFANAGQQTIAQFWSPKIAAERFLCVCESIQKNNPPPKYGFGPMAMLE